MRSNSGASLLDVLREVLSQTIASPLSLDATPQSNRTNIVRLGAQNASLVDFSAKLLSPSSSSLSEQSAATNSSNNHSSIVYEYALTFALSMDPRTLGAVLNALAAAAYNKSETPTPSPTLSGLNRRQLRASASPLFSPASEFPKRRRRLSSSSGSGSGSDISSSVGSSSDVGGGLPAWRFSRVDAVDALRFTVINELGSEALTIAVNTALASDGVVVTVGSNSIVVQQVTRAPTAVPTPPPTRPPTLQPTGHPTSVPVFAPTPLPTPVRSAQPTVAPVVKPDGDGFPLGVLGASLGGAILLFLGLSGVGFWMARKRGYCGGGQGSKNGDASKDDAVDESGMGKGAAAEDEARGHDLAKKRQARRASLNTAQVNVHKFRLLFLYDCAYLLVCAVPTAQ